MDFNNEIEEDINLFDVVDEVELKEDDEEFKDPDDELDFENGSLDGYTEMVEAEDEESDILE